MFCTVFSSFSSSHIYSGPYNSTSQVTIGIPYRSIVTLTPYNWFSASASYVNTGQIIVALIAFPPLGQASREIIRWRVNKNGGIHEPEPHIISLVIIITIGTFTAVLYGHGAARPEYYHWLIYFWALAAYFFAFVGASIVGTTYLLDGYPARAGPVLVIICALEVSLLLVSLTAFRPLSRLLGMTVFSVLLVA